MAAAAHPKRSPSGVGDGVGLKEERLSVRKPSTSTIGSRSIPTPSSPMVSSAHNPNKAEIPDRRKDVASAAVRQKILQYPCGARENVPFKALYFNCYLTPDDLLTSECCHYILFALAASKQLSSVKKKKQNSKAFM